MIYSSEVKTYTFPNSLLYYLDVLVAFNMSVNTPEVTYAGTKAPTRVWCLFSSLSVSLAGNGVGKYSKEKDPNGS